MATIHPRENPPEKQGLFNRIMAWEGWNSGEITYRLVAFFVAVLLVFLAWSLFTKLKEPAPTVQTQSMMHNELAG